MIADQEYHNGAKPIDGCIETKFTVFGCETAILDPTIAFKYECRKCLPGMHPYDDSWDDWCEADVYTVDARCTNYEIEPIYENYYCIECSDVEQYRNDYFGTCNTWNECLAMGFIADDFSMVCLPPCAENQYYDFFETHECVLCDTVIENCD